MFASNGGSMSQGTSNHTGPGFRRLNEPWLFARMAPLRQATRGTW